jgi:hypothetical protein
MGVNLDGLAKIVGLVLWADEKVTDQEMAAAKHLFGKYGISWPDAKEVLEQHVEGFLAPGTEDEEFEETDQDLELGEISLGEVDDFDVLCEVAKLAVADKEVTFNEIDIIHRIATAIGSQVEFATAALLKAVKESGADVRID